MKVLFLSGHAHLALDPAARQASGGAELQVALLAKALAARGIESVLAAARTGQEDGRVLSGVRVRVAGPFHRGDPVGVAASFGPILRVLRDERPDWVVVYGWTAWLAVVCALRSAAGCRVAFVCALDAEIDGGFRRANPVRGFLLDAGIAAADVRFGITSHHVGVFARRGLPARLTRLLLAEREPGPPAAPVDLLWVARCNAIKQPGLFLDLAEELPTARCRMICSDQDHALFASISARARTLANVEFLDRVPYHTIQSHFDSARIFVNTSTWEGVPNTFIHSAQGGAAVLSLHADPDGMFRTFGCGASFGGDFPALVRRAKDLLGNPSELAGMRAGAAGFLSEWHDNARNVDAFVEGLKS